MLSGTSEQVKQFMAKCPDIHAAIVGHYLKPFVNQFKRQPAGDEEVRNYEGNYLEHKESYTSCLQVYADYKLGRIQPEV